MVALSKIKQGLPLCQFPRVSFNHIAAILELFRAGSGINLEQQGDRWTVSIDLEWLSKYIEKDVSPMVDASDNAAADHFGKTHATVTVKTLGEDDEWKIEDEDGVLTEADKPLKIPKMVFDFGIKKVHDYKYTFSWLEADERIDTTGNVYLVTSGKKTSFDLTIPHDGPDPDPDPDPGGGGSGGDDDDGPGSGSGGGGGGGSGGGYDGPAPECGNPINNPGKGEGGGEDHNGGENPIDHPGPGGNTPECGDGQDDDDDYPL